MTLLLLLVVTALAIARQRDLFACVMLAGIYGLLSASFFVSMDAVDVAFTEAAVGAGVFPLLMLTALTVTGRYEQTAHRRPRAAFFLVLVTGALLILGTLDMPPFGSPDAPAHTHVAARYIQASPTEIGIPNMVTSVLADYRAFDTLGEVVVVFTAVVGVLILLTSGEQRQQSSPANAVETMRSHMILRVVSKMLIPLMLLFALYVQFHGEYGPGGGFQAGVIFAAAIILYAMLFGLAKAQAAIKPSILRLLAAFGVLLYGGVGVVSFLTGVNYLDYSRLAADPVAGRHIGILVIELGVGITVAAAMILIFYAFAGYATGRAEAE
ncbi:Na(+)/H(+) antiporter subunit B [uncultured Porticoccus sp.]|uniref:Na(+)/H(+) antiporter subunit B n=2 Tax=Porticoccus TaxID=1123967 RepID=UPI0030DD42B7